MPGWCSVLMGMLVAGVSAGSTVDPFGRESHKLSSIDNLLEELVSGPLQGHDIFLLHDKYNHHYVPRDSARMLVATNEAFNEGLYPAHYLRGPNRVAILLFSMPPATFLQHLALSDSWNPSFLLLISTNISLPSVTVLDDGVVQRSRHVVMLRPIVRGTNVTFTMLTSFPFRSRPHVHMGFWNKTRYKTMVDLFPDRYPSMEGALLRLGSWCDDFPFIYLYNDGCIGANLDALALIAAKLNFSYEVQKETQDQNWGALENGRWTGMLGDLAYNGRHLVINIFLVNYDRWRDFDTTYPYYAEGFGFLIRLPPPVPQWRSIMYPFTGHVWLAVIACTIVVSFISTVLSAIVVKESVDYSKHILMVCGGVTRQCVLLEGRGWLAVWWLSCIIITTAYTTNLIAFLTVPVYPSRLETVSELAQSPYRVTMQDYGNFVPAALNESLDASLAALGRKLDLFPVDNHYDPAMHNVLRGTHALTETFAYLANLQIQYNITDHTYLMKEQVYNGHMSWFLPKNTPYTHKVSRLLTTLRETGILSKLFHDHFPDTKAQNQRPKMSQLSVGQLQGAFLLLFLAHAVSFTCFMLEFVWIKKLWKAKKF